MEKSFKQKCLAIRPGLKIRKNMMRYYVYEPTNDGYRLAITKKFPKPSQAWKDCYERFREK